MIRGLWELPFRRGALEALLDLREKGFNVPEGILTVDEAMDCIFSLLDKEGKIW